MRVQRIRCVLRKHSLGHKASVREVGVGVCTFLGTLTRYTRPPVHGLASIQLPEVIGRGGHWCLGAGAMGGRGGCR